MSPAAEPTPASPSPAIESLAAAPWKPYLAALGWYVGIMAIVIVLLPKNYMWAGHDALSAVLRTQWLAELWQADGAGVSPWLPEALYGYGYPMFHYYAPLSYVVSAGLSAVLGFGAGFATKLSFYFSWILSGVAAWGLASILLRRDRTPQGEYWALAAALLYSLAPYHLCDLFSRGGLAECWAWAALAALFWALEWSRFNKAMGAFAIGAMWAALALSHNIFALYGTVLAVLYVLLTVGDWRWLVSIAAGALLGLLLSAYFWLPSLALLPWVHGNDPSLMLGTVGFLKEHAVFLGQWLIQGYGRGGSTAFIEPDFPVNPGPELVAATVLALVAILRPGLATQQRRRVSACAALLALIVLAASPVMPWQYAPPIFRYLQFPWRLVLPAVLMGIIAVVSAAPAISRRLSPRLLIAATLLLNLPNLYFLLFVPVSSEFNDQTLMGEMRLRDEYEMQSAGSIALEYLPMGVNPDIGQRAWQHMYPVPPNRLSATQGEVQVTSFVRNGTTYQYQYAAAADASAKVHVIFFPHWQLAIDGAPAPERLFETGDGLIGVDLPAGQHTFSLIYGKTPIESLATTTSLVALLLGIAAGIALFALRHRAESIQLQPRWAIASIVVLMIVGIIVEAGLRAHIVRRSLPDPARPGLPSTRHQYSSLTISNLLIPDEEIGDRLAPNVRGQWLGAPVIIDARGFRADGLVSTPTLDVLVVRIAALGGSAMFGWGIQSKQTIPAYLRRHLISRVDRGVHVEMINGAIPGSTTADQVKWAERAILPLNPDLIVLQHDFAESVPPFFFQPYRNRIFEMPWLLQPGKWTDDSLILKSLMKTAARPASQEQPLPAIERLAAICRQRNIGLMAVVTGHPGQNQAEKDRFLDGLKAANIFFIDMPDLARQLQETDMLGGERLFIDDGPEAHPTPLMNEISANALRVLLPRAVDGTRLGQFLADAPASAKLERPLDNELHVAPNSFYEVEDWAGEPVRWTQGGAALLALGQGERVKVKWWVGNPDVSTTRPLQVAVRIDRAAPINQTFTTTGVVGEVTHAYNSRAEKPRAVEIEIETDRMFFKPGDWRQLGIGLYPVEFE